MWRFLAILLVLAGIQGCGHAGADEQSASAETVSGHSVSLHVEGMMCAESCAKSVERILAARPGVQQVVVDFEQKRATCQVDPEAFDADDAVAELADQDFVARVEE